MKEGCKLNLRDKIEFLMNRAEINRAELSRATKIPYTTLDSILKRDHFENVKLEILRKLCAYFNVSLEYLVLDEIIDPGYRRKSSSIPNALSPDEQKLVEDYRVLSDRGKEHIRSCMDAALLAYSAESRDRVLYIARSGDQGETRITKDAQEEALRALDESSYPDL